MANFTQELFKKKKSKLSAFFEKLSYAREVRKREKINKIMLINKYEDGFYELKNLHNRSNIGCIEHNKLDDGSEQTIIYSSAGPLVKTVTPQIYNEKDKTITQSLNYRGHILDTVANSYKYMDGTSSVTYAMDGSIVGRTIDVVFRLGEREYIFNIDNNFKSEIFSRFDDEFNKKLSILLRDETKKQ